METDAYILYTFKIQMQKKTNLCDNRITNSSGTNESNVESK